MANDTYELATESIQLIQKKIEEASSHINSAISKIVDAYSYADSRLKEAYSKKYSVNISDALASNSTASSSVVSILNNCINDDEVVTKAYNYLLGIEDESAIAGELSKINTEANDAASQVGNEQGSVDTTTGTDNTPHWRTVVQRIKEAKGWDKFKEIMKTIGATIAAAFHSILIGIPKLLESLVDAVCFISGSIVCWTVRIFDGKDNTRSDAMLDGLKRFVAYDATGKWIKDPLYDKTGYGRWIAKNSFFDVKDGVVTSVLENAPTWVGAVALLVLAPEVALPVAVAVAGTAGLGKGAQTALQNGGGMGSAWVSGLLEGGFDALTTYLGLKGINKALDAVYDATAGELAESATSEVVKEAAKETAEKTTIKSVINGAINGAKNIAKTGAKYIGKAGLVGGIVFGDAFIQDGIKEIVGGGNGQGEENPETLDDGLAKDYDIDSLFDDDLETENEEESYVDDSGFNSNDDYPSYSDSGDSYNSSSDNTDSNTETQEEKKEEEATIEVSGDVSENASDSDPENEDNNSQEESDNEANSDEIKDDTDEENSSEVEEKTEEENKEEVVIDQNNEEDKKEEESTSDDNKEEEKEETDNKIEGTEEISGELEPEVSVQVEPEVSYGSSSGSVTETPVENETSEVTVTEKPENPEITSIEVTGSTSIDSSIPIDIVDNTGFEYNNNFFESIGEDNVVTGSGMAETGTVSGTSSLQPMDDSITIDVGDGTNIVSSDYDNAIYQKARDSYEALGDEWRAKQENLIVNEVDEVFDTDKEALARKLLAYGYGKDEINTIVKDRELTYKAMMAGYDNSNIEKIRENFSRSPELADNADVKTIIE